LSTTRKEEKRRARKGDTTDRMDTDTLTTPGTAGALPLGTSFDKKEPDDAKKDEDKDNKEEDKEKKEEETVWRGFVHMQDG